MKKLIALLLATLCVFSMVSGCSPKVEEEEKVLHYSLDGDITSPDPNYRTLTAEHNLYRQIYEPLYFFNHNDGTVENRLAESLSLIHI